MSDQDTWGSPSESKRGADGSGDDDLTPDLGGDDLTPELGDDLTPDLEPDSGGDDDAGEVPSKKKATSKKVDAGDDDDGGDDDDEATTAYGMSERSLKTLVRRIAKLTLGFADAPEDHVKCAGTALGLRGDFDASTLTVAVFTGETRAARSILRDMIESDVSDLAAAILLSGKIAQDRDMAIRWWNVASEVGIVDGNMPRATPQASVALVSGLAELTDEQRDVLNAASELLAWRR